METIYSKERFDSYTHRFIVEFNTGDSYSHNMTVYSNSDSYEELEAFINSKKTEKVISFEIVHRASKRQDEIESELIEESLKNWK